MLFRICVNSVYLTLRKYLRDVSIACKMRGRGVAAILFRRTSSPLHGQHGKKKKKNSPTTTQSSTLFISLYQLIYKYRYVCMCKGGGGGGGVKRVQAEYLWQCSHRWVNRQKQEQINQTLRDECWPSLLRSCHISGKIISNKISWKISGWPTACFCVFVSNDDVHSRTAWAETWPCTQHW